MALNDGTGDRIALTMHRSHARREGARGPRLVALVHGLGGSAESSYVLATTVGLLTAGLHVARVDLRGAGVRGLGLRTEAREYVPHMTLLRQARCGPGEFAFSEVPWHAADFALIQSAPRPGGVAYEVIGRWPLAERA